MGAKIPNRIKEILKLRKITRMYPSSLDTLSVEAEVARNTVVNLANGDYLPKIDTAYKIARALNVTVYDLWDEHDLREFLNDLNEGYAAQIVAAMKAAEDAPKK